jgi:hypothetical protein
MAAGILGILDSWRSLILAEKNLSFAKLADDLFGCKGFLWHFSPVLPEYILFSWPIPNS